MRLKADLCKKMESSAKDDFAECIIQIRGWFHPNVRYYRVVVGPEGAVQSKLNWIQRTAYIGGTWALQSCPADGPMYPCTSFSSISILNTI